MKIENRVEALELELKILKNEIQSTLLEIREQVLIHYYPELRAEEPVRAKPSSPRPTARDGRGDTPPRNSTPSSTRVAEHTAPVAAVERPKPVQPFSDISLQDLGIDLDLEQEFDQAFDDDYERPAPDLAIVIDDDEEDELDVDAELPTVRAIAAAPKTREVRLQQLKQGAPTPKAQRVAVERDPLGKKPNRSNFAALATWVSDSVTKVGKERTLQVVETYAASGGQLTPETKTALQQLITLATDTEPSGPVGNHEMLGLMVELDQLLYET